MFESLGRSAIAAAQTLRVRSALNPLLWLTAIVTPLCLIGAIASRDNATLTLLLLGFGFLPVVVTCAAFAYFAIRNPEKLQSEDYQIRHETLLLLQSKTGRIAVDTTSLSAIANPSLPALPSKTGADA